MDEITRIIYSLLNKSQAIPEVGVVFLKSIDFSEVHDLFCETRYIACQMASNIPKNEGVMGSAIPSPLRFSVLSPLPRLGRGSGGWAVE